MNILTFSDRLFWMAARNGKITGTRAKDIKPKTRGEGKKIGYYELIAEKLGIPNEEVETPMERGSRLEHEALERFVAETGKEVDMSLLLWQRDDEANIALSPDGVVAPKKKNGAIIEACEVKCLSAARHIEAYLTHNVPDEYWDQCLQYFVVNDDLKTLNFICYDPRFGMNPKVKIDYFVIEIQRAEVEKEVAEALANQKAVIAEVRKVVNELTF